MQALRNTIKNSGLSNPELSIKLGHSRKYLTNLLNDGCSTELQNRLIEEISQVMAGTFKTDAEVIAELTQRLVDVQDDNSGIRDDLRDQIDQNIGLTNENQTLRKNAQNHDIAISEHQATITHLTAQLNQSRETMSKQNALNTELNAECNKYRSELQQLGKEFHYARSELSRVDAKNNELTEQIDIKNHGEITMNQTMYKLRQQQKIHRLLSLVCLATIILLIVVNWGV